MHRPRPAHDKDRGSDHQAEDKIAQPRDLDRIQRAGQDLGGDIAHGEEDGRQESQTDGAKVASLTGTAPLVAGIAGILS